MSRFAMNYDGPLISFVPRYGGRQLVMKSTGLFGWYDPAPTLPRVHIVNLPYQRFLMERGGKWRT